jgi:hypothetical protein
MKKFVWGVLLGLFLGGAATATAVTSTDGPMLGWTVEDADGDEVCTDPWMYRAVKTIECN